VGLNKMCLDFVVSDWRDVGLRLSALLLLPRLWLGLLVITFDFHVSEILCF